MKSVLITGGTGSLGNALAERFINLGVPKIRILSRNERDQALMRQKFPQITRFIIRDVRDREGLRRAMEGCDVVIHAAALKRIEVGIYDTVELILTNVLGSVNVTEAARDAGVEKTILVSTDKAVAPISPYGNSKALAEQIFRTADDHYRASGSLYSVVRYGNVWGSNGSVVPKWRAIGREAGHCEITDPDCTRFFITLPQAVDFILGTIASMPQRVRVPKLPAYRMGDLAEAMGINPTVTGLPKHEKLHEIMELDGPASNEVRRMSVEELRSYL